MSKNKISEEIINVIKEDVDTVIRVKDCVDSVDLINALEGDSLKIEDKFDWEKVKELARDFASSQGFYGRLLRDMIEYEESVGEDGMEFPIIM